MAHGFISNTHKQNITIVCDQLDLYFQVVCEFVRSHEVTPLDMGAYTLSVRQTQTDMSIGTPVHTYESLLYNVSDWWHPL